jgi:hypothetical protein
MTIKFASIGRFLGAAAAVAVALFLVGWAGDARADVIGDKSLEQYWAEMRSDNCALCEFSGRFIEITDAFARDTYDVLAPELVSFVTYVFLLYITIQGTKLLVPFGAGSPADIVWTIIKRSMLFFFCLAFMRTPELYWDWVYEPAIATAGRLSNSIITGISALNIHGDIGLEMEGSACGAFKSIYSDQGLRVVSNKIDYTTVSEITCQIHKLQIVNTAGALIGIAMMTDGTGWVPSLTAIGGMILQMLSGGLLVVMFGLAILLYPFFFIDLIFRLGFLSAMMPIFIAGFVFPSTRGWLKKAGDGILTSLMTLVSSSIVFGFTAVLLAHAPTVFRDADGNRLSSMAELLKVIETENIPINFTDQAYIYLLVAAASSLTLSRKITSMVQTIFGFSDGPGMGRTLQGLLQTGAGLAGAAAFAFGPAAMRVGGRVGMGTAGGVARLGGMAGSAAYNSFMNTSAGQRIGSIASQAVNPLKNLFGGRGLE